MRRCVFRQSADFVRQKADEILGAEDAVLFMHGTSKVCAVVDEVTSVINII